MISSLKVLSNIRSNSKKDQRSNSRSHFRSKSNREANRNFEKSSANWPSRVCCSLFVIISDHPIRSNESDFFASAQLLNLNRFVKGPVAVIFSWIFKIKKNSKPVLVFPFSKTLNQVYPFYCLSLDLWSRKFHRMIHCDLESDASWVFEDQMVRLWVGC